jgi:hypothetical protein
LISPLVLDLDGDGIELSTLAETGALFDLDGDGFAEKTGWVRPEDGILAIDLNGNGLIDDISEVFGNATTNGFAELAALDTNADGVIDAQDAQFGELLVWQDANGNGFSEEHELKTLADHGITSISLNSTPSGQILQGHLISDTATFTRSDGSTDTIADVWFEHDQTLTVDNDPDTQLEFFAGGLPRLRGYGEVAHLHIAASVDHQLFAQAFALTLDAFTDLASYRADVEALLYRWAGTEAVPLDSRGGQVDARKLETLEKFTGLPFEHTGGGIYMGQHVASNEQRSMKPAA